MIPDATPRGWTVRVGEEDGPAVLLYPDGSACFQHLCDRGERGTITCAPALRLGAGHEITQHDPLTVTPSILCPDCGMHGFMADGVWRGC